MKAIDVAQLRERAGLTQAEIAERLGIPQSQVSRYELNPEDIPQLLFLKWIHALGYNLNDVSGYSLTEESVNMDVGKPFERVTRNLDLLEQYIDTAPASQKELESGRFTVEALRAMVQQLKRKPVIAFSGAFDSAKSRLANALLGGDYLPTDYQPTTKLVIHVRHISDRPDWIKETVWIMGDDKNGNPFELDDLNDQKACEAKKIVAGSLDTLKSYGSHVGVNGKDERAMAALLFIDSPILEACSFIDLPGYDDTEADSKKAESIANQYDILFYNSNAKGFLKGEDHERLKYLLKMLPPVENASEEIPPLANLFIVASHADPSISDDQLNNIKNIGAERLYGNLSETLSSIESVRNDTKIDVDVLKSRIFPFWYENKQRWAGLADTLKRHLSEEMVLSIETQLDRQIQQYKKNAKAAYTSQIKAYEDMIKNLAQLETQYDEMVAQEPERRSVVKKAQTEVLDAIKQKKSSNLSALNASFNEIVNKDSVESILRRKYSDKKEAQRYAISHINDLLQGRIEKSTKELSKEFILVMEGYIETFESQSTGLAAVTEKKKQDPDQIYIPFDSRGAFIGGLAGLGTVGALTFWAASLGNLGGYIIAAKTASVLSALGISLAGGSATIVSLMAALGGPVTIAIGIGLVIAAIGYALFGESWQSRLAKRIVKLFAEKKVKDQYEKSISEYWADTKKAFEKGAEALECEYQKKMDELKSIIKSKQSKDDLQERIKGFEETRDFFAGIPWKPIVS